MSVQHRPLAFSNAQGTIAPSPSSNTPTQEIDMRHSLSLLLIALFASVAPAQALPGNQIPDEVKEKMQGGLCEAVQRRDAGRWAHPRLFSGA